MIGEFGEVKTTNLLFSLKCTEKRRSTSPTQKAVSSNRPCFQPKVAYRTRGKLKDADSLHLLLGMRIAALLPVKSETKDGTKSEGTRKEGK